MPAHGQAGGGLAAGRRQPVMPSRADQATAALTEADSLAVPRCHGGAQGTQAGTAGLARESESPADHHEDREAANPGRTDRDRDRDFKFSGRPA